MTRAVPRFRYAVRALSVALTVVGAVAATRLPAPALTVGLTLPLRGSPPAAGNHGTGNTAVDMASANYLPSAGFRRRRRLSLGLQAACPAVATRSGDAQADREVDIPGVRNVAPWISRAG